MNLADRAPSRARGLGRARALVATTTTAVLVATGCGSDKAKSQPQAPPPAAVIVADAVRQTVPVYGDFVAQTEANTTVELRARVEGTLERAFFKEGTPVRQDEVMFQIDPREYRSKLESARAQLAKAEADLAYARQQVETRKAQAQLDRDIADLAFARQQVETRKAQAQLDRDIADLAFARQQVGVLKAQAQVVEEEARLAKARQDVARYRPLVEQEAVPKQDLDNALAAEQVALATVKASEANLENTRLLETNKVATSEATVKASQANLENTRLTERTQIDLGQAAVQAARAAVTRAELDLGYTTVRSPLDGIVGRLAVNPGNLVGRGESTLLATVSSPDPLYVNFAMSESDYLRIAKRIGLGGPRAPTKGAFELLLADDSVFPERGDFVLIERALDARTGTLTVRTVFPNPGGVLRPGQFGRVRVVIEERRDAVLVPQRAIVVVQDSKAVLVVAADNKVALRTVQLAEGYQDLVIVANGLQGGERVIVEGQQKTRPGATVAPSLQPARAPGTGSVPATAPVPAAGSQPAAAPGTGSAPAAAPTSPPPASAPKS